ncbi:MAG: putative bifunctional diguanylate cyclase/phosphodiesterase [Geminicoccaceae bacterium]
MHKLLARQLTKAEGGQGLDQERLLDLIGAAYTSYERDRARTDRTVALMIEENDQLQRELQAVIEKLAVQNSRFVAALENMPHGLCMFDGNHRLVIANGQLADLFRLPAYLTKIGTPVGDILMFLSRHGILQRSERKKLGADALNALAKSGPLNVTWELTDGRYIEIALSGTNDGGWVAVCEDVTAQHRAQARIRHMARHDALTDLPNRVQFHEAMAWHFGRTDRGEKVVVMCLDLDHFKIVNDTLGHPVGDKLLLAVAERLGTCIRHGDLVARLGGDEFAIIQVGVDQPVGASSLAQRIIDQLGAPYMIDGQELSISVSIGIAIAPDDGQNSDQLLKNADLALYRAKEDGRGHLCFFEREMDAEVQARRAMEFDLRQALNQEEFELYYQPLVNLSDDEISGFEALIRWNHPRRGRVAPDEFIQLAEETGLIGAIGEWVLHQACHDAMSWPQSIKVAVNLSPVQFRTPALIEAVTAALEMSSLDPARLELEITETVMLQDTEHTIGMLSSLRRLGVSISMDDFGTGYSSLSYLRRFPFDKIKIDQSFIYDLEHAQDALAIIRAVTGLSTSLGMTTTAEGVETSKQLATLRAEGCTEVQGYLISPPLPALEVTELLRRTSSIKTASG